MEEFEVDAAVLRAEVESLARLFACMIRPLFDTGICVPGSDWTVGEHAAHLASSQRGFATIVEGVPIDYRGNDHQLACFQERGGAVLADSIVDSTRDLLKAAADNEGIERTLPGFSPRSMRQWTSYSLCHVLMHAAPVARALGMTSPVRSCHLALALPFLEVVLPSILDRSEAAGICGRLGVQTTDGPSFSLVFADGELDVEPSLPASADCYLTAPAGVFFSVSLGLEPEKAAIERGDWKISGPCPELGQAFKRLLPNP